MQLRLSFSRRIDLVRLAILINDVNLRIWFEFPNLYFHLIRRPI